MRYALISDIHGNLPALDAVLANIDTRSDVDATYHLGDLVGYSPWPNEVVARLHDAGVSGVSGNYDSTVALDYKHCGCRSENAAQEALAHASFEWTRHAVTADTKRFLSTLPHRLDLRPHGAHLSGPTLTLVHATPLSNLVYVTEDRSDDFLRKLAAQAGLQSGDAIAYGHTHVPWTRAVDGVQFINTGSVGRPKDGDPRAVYAVVTMIRDRVDVNFVRVAYDVEATACAVLASTLPDEFANFLRTGGAKVAPPQ
jgi:predicted phosphodiesterase